MSTYRALNGENGPVVVCDDDEPGTVMAMTGRQQDAEEIAAALNNRDALESLRAAWNEHMKTCPQHAKVPTFEEIDAWMKAPSNTASADLDLTNEAFGV